MPRISGAQQKTEVCVRRKENSTGRYILVPATFPINCIRSGSLSICQPGPSPGVLPICQSYPGTYYTTLTTLGTCCYGYPSIPWQACARPCRWTFCCPGVGGCCATCKSATRSREKRGEGTAFHQRCNVDCGTCVRPHPPPTFSPVLTFSLPASRASFDIKVGRHRRTSIWLDSRCLNF